MFDRIHKAADAHKETVRKYGIAGLFLFVWFPFWMTGPVVGCVIGFMIGLRIRLNLSIVLAGTYMAIIGWAVFLRDLLFLFFTIPIWLARENLLALDSTSRNVVYLRRSN